MSKNLDDLRSTLFETMQALKDKKITIEEAKAVSDIGQTIINSAKVEVDYIKASSSALQSKFIENNQADNLPPDITGTTVHRIKG